jgi:hypothetical protein
MPALEKAKLQEITAGAHPTPVPNAELDDVQFNPASLKLQLANVVGSDQSRAQQASQYLGKTSTTLTFDLYFDTADLGTTDHPVSVRAKTAAVERFVLPKQDGKSKQKPPKARFTWGDLVLDGIIESINVDFEHFAADGTPLRAKVAVSLKEQDAKYQLLQSGAGANQGSNPTPPGQNGVGPGNNQKGPTDSTQTALAGESAAEFAARAGLDPAAWRGFAAGLDSTLSLKAGLEIDFSASLSVGAGIGVSVGIESGASVSLEATLGLEANVSASAGASFAAGASSGFALAAAGGVSAAIETAKIVRAETASAAARQSFGGSAPLAAIPSAGTAARGAAQPSAGGQILVTPGGPNSARMGLPEQPRPPLGTHGMPSPAAQAAAAPAPAPPLADSRSTSFGFGVPLRPRVGSAAELRAAAIAGRIALRPRSRPDDVLVSEDPTGAPWTHLPPDRARDVADRAQRSARPLRPCGCSGGCSHGATR